MFDSPLDINKRIGTIVTLWKTKEGNYLNYFAMYFSFLHHLQLASHDLAATWQKEWRKIKILLPAFFYTDITQ